ncbi:START domain-containing protein [Marinicella sp. S1101]|uniref:START domain-containing protein n=1 Tax=Marinicella marina TaxID=2996016 RepID=UPI002260C5A6|nr:START domain-containing protein [Marinicella marina]MCX7552270.1 START domain-containing protein [Marinicella marina]MDJ1139146.1 START domain-containing protein [Marinicella marina]
MMKLIMTLMLACLVMAAAGAEENWQLVKDKDQIQIFATQKTGHKLKHHKAETEINKDVDTILAALQDTAACPEWVYQCITNKMVEMIDVKQRIYHTSIDSPLWFKSRDFYLQSDVSFDPKTRSFVIVLVSIPNHAGFQENHVRLTDVSMIWRLHPIGESLTAVSYEVYIDPELPIKSINHQMIKRSIFKTIEGLRHLVEKPIYAQTKYTASELEMLVELD